MQLTQIPERAEAGGLAEPSDPFERLRADAGAGGDAGDGAAGSIGALRRRGRCSCK